MQLGSIYKHVRSLSCFPLKSNVFKLCIFNYKGETHQGNKIIIQAIECFPATYSATPISLHEVHIFTLEPIIWVFSKEVSILLRYSIQSTTESIRMEHNRNENVVQNSITHSLEGHQLTNPNVISHVSIVQSFNASKWALAISKEDY